MVHPSAGDWEFFKVGAGALFVVLALIPIERCADLLVGICWTGWIDGMGTEALKFVSLALEPNHVHHALRLTPS